MRIAQAAAVATTLALGLAALANSAPAANPVKGSAGPGFGICLTMAGKRVTQLKAGVPYRFVIVNRAALHHVRVSGPDGLSKQVTSVDFNGTKSVVLMLKKGTYRYGCDSHASLMKGSFEVS
jgi:plastocyanin